MSFKTRSHQTFDRGQAGDHSCHDEGTEEAREGVTGSADHQRSQDWNLGLPSLNSGWWHLTLVVWGTRAWELGSESPGVRSRLVPHSLLTLSGFLLIYFLTILSLSFHVGRMETISATPQDCGEAE